eukprot:gene10188-biopygen16770
MWVAVSAAPLFDAAARRSMRGGPRQNNPGLLPGWVARENTNPGMLSGWVAREKTLACWSTREKSFRKDFSNGTWSPGVGQECVREALGPLSLKMRFPPGYPRTELSPEDKDKRPAGARSFTCGECPQPFRWHDQDELERAQSW